MNTELLGIIATYAITLLIAIPLGRYIAKVFSGQRTLLDFMAPLERGSSASAASIQRKK